MSSPQVTERTPRRYDLDWLRVLVILFVFVNHVGRIFEGTWVISNDVRSSHIGNLLAFTSFLRMPVLFFIAGAGTWFLFRRRSGLTYLRDRFLRLGVPFFVSVLLLVPIQHYFVVRSSSESAQSYPAEWLSFLGAAIRSINNHWEHLWFIAYLLIFSVVAAPVFLYLKTPRGDALLQRTLDFVNHRFGVLLLAVPIIVIEWSMRWKWPGNANLTDDWARVLVFFTLFVYGYLLFGSERFWDLVDQYKTHALVAGIFCATVWISIPLTIGAPVNEPGSPTYALFWLFRALNQWIWLIALLGYARHFLSFENRLLRYARDASYPFYLLHQPIIIAVGFYVIALPLHPGVKILLIGAISMAMTLGVYEFVVRRSQIMRFGFGMKPIWTQDMRSVVPRTKQGLAALYAPSSGDGPT